MKCRLLSILGLIVMVLVALAPSPAKAQTVAPGPYYANPSWDQTLACTTLATCPRFIVLSNMGSNAVLDRETGLVWEKSPSTSNFTWSDAQSQCIELNAGGRTGWRLPTLQELMSLVDRSVPFPGPTLPSGHPFINVHLFYWSATSTLPSRCNASCAWAVDFTLGFGYPENTSGDFLVWCVRGGQGVDPQ